MRHVLVGVILGAALGLTGQAALACGDHVDCAKPAPGGAALMRVETQRPQVRPVQAAGSPTGRDWWIQTRGENREH